MSKRINLETSPLDDPVEKGIVKILTGKKNQAMTVDEVVVSLKKTRHQEIEPSVAVEKLDNLIDRGYVGSKTYGEKAAREERFYLTRYPFHGGVTKKREDQGRGLISESKKLYKNLFGSIFILLGLGLFVYKGLSITGNTISSGAGATSGFVVAFLLLIIGGFFLMKRNN